MPDTIQTSTVAKNNNLGDCKVAESNNLNVTTISLIAVCCVLAILVIVFFVISIRNKGHKVKPWIISIDKDNEKGESRMLPEEPKIEDNACLYHARFKTDGNDGIDESNILSGNRQPENKDATYSVVNDDLKAACRILPSVLETPQEPPCLTNVYDPFQEVSLSPEGWMRSRIGSTPSYRFARGFQLQNSTASTYECSIRPFSRSTNVVSEMESSYEDMNKTSWSSSMC
ncbi:uncharacterized protein LOC117124480 [Anneissia japonica]|uniref:uncharacterized protein LOC117124480 n=1 Tax=Anneissia japonica TaxID=1529436 RepID=UPI001425A19B|nr:uncharacterized protein LOC117124480 [Anneissia japonica]